MSAAEARRYNPMQPRDPGGKDGGRWVGTGGASGGTGEWLWGDDEPRFALVPEVSAPGNLSSEQRGELLKYSRGGYRELNEPLMDGRSLPENLERRAQVIDSALAEAGDLEKPRTVWRGVNFGGREHGEFILHLPKAEQERLQYELVADWAEETWRPGEVYEPRGFQSTSFSPAPALNAATGRTDPGVIFEIRAKTGVFLDPEEGLTGFDDEDELLQGRAARYRVRGVLREVPFEQEGGETLHRTVVQLEEI
ncbi:MAG: hypothetical protein M3522_11050 [Actinomycetota bacterium]|nr:hypothetical protein [Actinomycetota bacterium]